MSSKTKSPLLSAPVLVVMLALLLAVAGVVYAHWTANLNLDANVQTGSVQVQWNEAWTNDDGAPNTHPHDAGLNDSELIEPDPGLYNGTSTSRDPMERGFNPLRWDKDVAECYAGAGGDHMNVDIWGAYPSYNCDMTALISVNGNVPVRATAINFAANRDGEPLEIEWGDIEGNFELGQTHDIDDEPTFVAEIEGDIGTGVYCGTQLDPSGCQWYLGAGTEWHGPVSQDDEGFFADLDGYGIDCEPSMDLPEFCWADQPDGYEPNGERDDGDMPVFQECSGDLTVVEGWLHVLQPAWQNANYQYSIGQEFVNWNEFDYCLCTHGVPAADEWGALVGMVDHDVDGCLVN